MRKRLTLLFVFVFTISIFAYGCSTAQRPLNPQQPNNMGPNNNITQPNMENSLSDGEARAMAKRLAKIAEDVDGVKRASVVVNTGDMSDGGNMGNTGIDNDGMGNTGIGNTGNTGNIGNVGSGTPNFNNTNRQNNMGTNNNMPNNNMNTPGGSPGPGSTWINDTNSFPGVRDNRTDNNRDNLNQIVVMVGIELDNNTGNMTNNAGNTNNTGMVGNTGRIGNTANTGNTGNMSNTSNIEKVVADKIKASDHRIGQVFVTSDKNMMSRIDDVAKDVANGKPIGGLRNDIDNLWRNLTGQNRAF